MDDDKLEKALPRYVVPINGYMISIILSRYRCHKNQKGTPLSYTLNCRAEFN